MIDYSYTHIEVQNTIQLRKIDTNSKLTATTRNERQQEQRAIANAYTRPSSERLSYLMITAGTARISNVRQCRCIFFALF